MVHLTILDGKPNISDKLAALCTEAGLTTMLNGIGEGFYAVDGDWRIILFNNEAAQHFHRDPGRGPWPQSCGKRFPARARRASASSSSRPCRAAKPSARKPSPSIFGGRWLAYRLFPLGDGIGVVFRDITDRRNAEAQRDLLVQELEHRIKNTLTMVQSIADQTFRNSGARSGRFSRRLRRVWFRSAMSIRF